MKKNQTLETGVYRLPSWAVLYFINNDIDHMSESEKKAADKFINRCKIQSVCCPTTDSFFSHRNDIDNLGGDCYDCTVIYQ